jgi:hypothetical protein
MTVTFIVAAFEGHSAPLFTVQWYRPSSARLMSIIGYSSPTTFGLAVLVHVTFRVGDPEGVHARVRLDPSSTVLVLPKFCVIVGVTVKNKYKCHQ